MAEPRQTPLRQILRKPDAQKRVGRAVASLLGVGIVSIAAIGALLIWHVSRRGRLIQERLAPPRNVALPDLGDLGLADVSDTDPSRPDSSS